MKVQGYIRKDQCNQVCCSARWPKFIPLDPTSVLTTNYFFYCMGSVTQFRPPWALHVVHIHSGSKTYMQAHRIKSLKDM